MAECEPDSLCGNFNAGAPRTLTCRKSWRHLASSDSTGWDGKQAPIHAVSSLAHADFRHPAPGYLSVLRLTRLVTSDEREVLQMLGNVRRGVFVVFHDRDDLSRNLSYGRDEEGRRLLRGTI